jgi:hypothetical protein
MRANWEQTLRQLRTFLNRCQRHRLPAAFVVVPSEFQIDSALCETACRRNGCRPESLDLDLPQRRLATFARQQGVPLFDLLPHLRASRDPVFARGTAHFNHHGNATAAEVLGAWLACRYEPVIVAALDHQTRR